MLHSQLLERCGSDRKSLCVAEVTAAIEADAVLAPWWKRMLDASPGSLSPEGTVTRASHCVQAGLLGLPLLGLPLLGEEMARVPRRLQPHAEQEHAAGCVLARRPLPAPLTQLLMRDGAPSSRKPVCLPILSSAAGAAADVDLIQCLADAGVDAHSLSFALPWAGGSKAVLTHPALQRCFQRT